MLFKSKIWELTKPEAKNIIAFCADDAVALNIFKKDFLGHIELKAMFPEDMSPQWVQNNLQTLDLFGGGDSFSFYNSEKISVDTTEELMSDTCQLDGRTLVFFFNKENKFFKNLSEREDAYCVKLVSPSFWEYDDVLSFLLNKAQLNLAPMVRDFIVKNIENTTSTMFSFVESLKAYSAQELSDPNLVYSLLEKSKFDQFEIAKNFSHRNLRGFYSEILKIDDYGQLRSIFSFLQGHMIKVYDPSYMQAKKKLSKYDREIQSYGNKWSDDQIKRSLLYLSELELSSKKRDPFLKEKLQRDFLRV